MNYQNSGLNVPFRIGIWLIIIFIILYSLLRVFIFTSDPILPLFLFVYEVYIYLAEGIINIIISLSGRAVSIISHKITISNYPEFQSANEHILNNWTNYLLFKKWAAFILVLIWAIKSQLRKKLINTGIFILVHFISMVSGLLVLILIAPSITVIESETRLNANSPGIILMITFLAFWIKNNKIEIHSSLEKLKINSKVFEKKGRQLFIFLYIFFILNAIVIPLLSFGVYSRVITGLTEGLLRFLKYEVFADGIYLFGKNESLKILKSCLGLKTILLFVSVVFITGGENKKRWLYMLFGFILLNLINVIRLVVLFIYVQKNGEYRLDHFHDLYTYIVYAVVFILWIIWFEKIEDMGVKFSSFRFKSNREKKLSA